MPFHIQLHDQSAAGTTAYHILKTSAQLTQRHHVLYYDRHFTSAHLALDLLRLGHYSCGTVDTRRSGVPACRAVLDDTGRGTEAAVSHGGLLFVSHRDTTVVNVLSTAHNLTDQDAAHKPPAHKALVDFRKFKGGVDLWRLLLSNFDPRGTVRWTNSVHRRAHNFAVHCPPSRWCLHVCSPAWRPSQEEAIRLAVPRSAGVGDVAGSCRGCETVRPSPRTSGHTGQA